MATNEEQLVQQVQTTDQAAQQPVQQQNVGASTGVSKAVTAGSIPQSKLNEGKIQTVMPANDYSSPYDQQLKDLYDQIVNRKEFSYDANDDQMYQAYKDRYTQLGQQAMKDTMGQAAALTGGYGSSYGQAVGQQTYDQYMLGLNDKANELYQMAYQRYKDEGDRQLQNYSMMGDLADRDYKQWSDAYSRGASAYALAGDEAAARAQYGDFSGYEDLYGKDVADRMKFAWAAANPDAAFASGIITADQYYTLTGTDPHIRPAAGGDGGGDVSGNWYQGNWYKATGTQHDQHNKTGELYPGAGGTGKPMDKSDYYNARSSGVSHSEIVKLVNS